MEHGLTPAEALELMQNARNLNQPKLHLTFSGAHVRKESRCSVIRFGGLPVPVAFFLAMWFRDALIAAFLRKIIFP